MTGLLRVDEFDQRATQFARAGRLGLELVVGVGHGGIEQRQLRGRAQHHDLAAQVLKVPDVLVETLWRDVMGRHTQHGQLNRVFGLVGSGHAVGEVVQRQIRGHAQAAIFKLVEHGLTG